MNTVQIVPRRNEAELCSVSDLTSMTDDELVAIVQTAFKIKDALPHIQELRNRFAQTHRGRANIRGCSTWAEFCKKILHRTDRAVRKALAEPKLVNQAKQLPKDSDTPKLKKTLPLLPAKPILDIALPDVKTLKIWVVCTHQSKQLSAGVRDNTTLIHAPAFLYKESADAFVDDLNAGYEKTNAKAIKQYANAGELWVSDSQHARAIEAGL